MPALSLKIIIFNMVFKALLLFIHALLDSFFLRNTAYLEDNVCSIPDHHKKPSIAKKQVK